MSATTPPPDPRPAAARPSRPPAAPERVGGRDNNFNLIRFGLAALVILSHSPELVDDDRRREVLTRLFGTLSLGDVAVDGFFLLSGYLIVESWRRSPRLFGFFKNRALRIYPGFLVASLISALVVGPLGSDPAAYFTGFSWWKFAAQAIQLQPPSVPPVFAGRPHPFLNAPMWTIAYEFRCYTLVALLGVCGLAGRRLAWLGVVALALAGVLAPRLVPGVSSWLARNLVGDPQHLARFVLYFAAGACFCLNRARIPFRASWAATAGVVLLVCLFRDRPAQVGMMLLGGYLLFWFAFAPTPRLAWFRSLPDISYGVYLYGWPIGKLLCWFVPSISPWALFALNLAAACGCGWLSWTFVEEPCLRLKRHSIWSRRPAPPEPMPALAPAASGST